jgi:hypothetical protein
LRDLHYVTNNASVGAQRLIEDVKNLSPAIGITASATQTGLRISSAFNSLKTKGFYSSSFCLNSASASLSGMSFGLQVVAYYTKTSCPRIALPCYGASHICGLAADRCDQVAVNFIG